MKQLVPLCGSQRIFYLPFDDTTDRPNLGYIHGDTYSFAVDAGNSPFHAALFLHELEDHGLPVPTYIGITHWHWDHTFAMVSYPHSQIVACNRTQEYLHQMMAWKWDDASMKARVCSGEDIKFCDTYIKREYPDRSVIQVVPANISFEDEYLIDLGSLHCQLLRLPNSHSDDCCVVYIPEEETLFVGDIYGEDFHHGWPPKHHQDKLRQLIDALDKIPCVTVVPGHELPLEKNAFIAQLKDHLR